MKKMLLQMTSGFLQLESTLYVYGIESRLTAKLKDDIRKQEKMQPCDVTMSGAQ
jgi:hypothetical protein